MVASIQPWEQFYREIRELLHLPGLRGNPERAYPLSPAPEHFDGSFRREYVASVLWSWQSADDSRVSELATQMAELGLTWKVLVKPQSEVAGEILVGRLPAPRRGGAHDLVSIADVGFGASQVLPVLVALLAAKPGQIVSIEQPELHLHPEAEAVMAKILVEAAARGVIVVAETHSPLLLLAAQTLVVEGHLPPEDVQLYWFERDEEGAAQVTEGGLDERGAYNGWPVDFSEVEMRYQEEFVRKVLAHGAAVG
jgi:hypothetical protein